MCFSLHFLPADGGGDNLVENDPLCLDEKRFSRRVVGSWRQQLKIYSPSAGGLTQKLREKFKTSLRHCDCTLDRRQWVWIQQSIYKIERWLARKISVIEFCYYKNINCCNVMNIEISLKEIALTRETLELFGFKLFSPQSSTFGHSAAVLLALQKVNRTTSFLTTVTNVPKPTKNNLNLVMLKEMRLHQT